MTENEPRRLCRYRAPERAESPEAVCLVMAGEAGAAERYPFVDRLEIGRDGELVDDRPGRLLVADPTVSHRHCILTRRSDGRCVVRDVSRNGTRVDGRRLLPNVEVEIRPGQILSVSPSAQFTLVTECLSTGAGSAEAQGLTVSAPSNAIVTVLVGDIRDYTGLVRRTPSSGLQRSLSRLFERLTAAVLEHGGTVKEYQGDALMAFWEAPNLAGTQAVAACRAALALDRLAARLATDRTVWQVEGFPLQMDWALATGHVLIDSFGGARPVGLSMIGEPVVRAFRIEKFANDEVGRILVCAATRECAGDRFTFRDMGEMTGKGFDRPDRVFELEGPLERADSPTR